MTSSQSVSPFLWDSLRHKIRSWCGWVRWQNGTFKNLRTSTGQQQLPSYTASAARCLENTAFLFRSKKIIQKFFLLF
ncbi:MAG: hypothetical protein HC815_29035 [Richelia sp. RM1_1_1]|nr:hypothetical protein [Richelia sp. RM1_1_1]